jgi:hypothetical protein
MKLQCKQTALDTKFGVFSERTGSLDFKEFLSDLRKWSKSKAIPVTGLGGL